MGYILPVIEANDINNFISLMVVGNQITCYSYLRKQGGIDEQVKRVENACFLG
jgi:hypothetical protein